MSPRIRGRENEAHLIKKHLSTFRYDAFKDQLLLISSDLYKDIDRHIAYQIVHSLVTDL